MKNLLIILCTIAVSFWTQAAESKGPVSLNNFEALAVLDQGRYKPIDSVARATLLSIYGKSKFKMSNGVKLTPIEWLARLLFTPQETETDKLFLVDDPDVVNAMGIKTVAARGHYSFKELSATFPTFEKLVDKAFTTEKDNRTRFETHLLELYQKIVAYTDTGRNIMKITDEKSQTIWFYMATGYITRDQAAFDTAIESHQKSLGDKINAEDIERIRYEVTFNKSDIFFRSGLVLALALMLCLVGLAGKERVMTLMALTLCIVAFIMQTYGIYSRMIIMSRPPVTNLYSTFICTSWTCLLIGIAIYKTLPDKFKRMSPITAALAGISFLIISGKYESGDNLGVMVAVLNSNFWLSTHVTTIILGYSFCCFSGLFAHFYLISRITNAKDPQLTQTLFTIMMGVLGIGFTTTFIGTILGGIWADQSWGRFWGWDPKENGALLIVLWSAAVFHTKVGGLLKRPWIAVGCMLGIQVVMVAWFGINKLGVGLHSYGNDPDSNAFRNLAYFAIFELVFILIVPFWGNKKQQAHKAAK